MIRRVAIPLMTLTLWRVTHLYELMDSAYDADAIHEHSRQLNHVPIIAPHPRRGTKKSSQLPKVFPDKPTPQLTWAQQDRYKTRTMSERVNARLKDEFGASHLRVRGAVKVMAHLMFGVLALTVDQWLRMSAQLAARFRFQSCRFRQGTPTGSSRRARRRPLRAILAVPGWFPNVWK